MKATSVYGASALHGIIMLRDTIYRMAGCLLVLALALGISAAGAQEVRLGPGDVVRISVYGHKDLESVVQITNDGNINFPLVGTVALAGLTTREAEIELAERLAAGNFVRDSQVSIFVERRRMSESDSATILGQVARPGRFAVDPVSENAAESIIGLIALAGGTTDKAADHLFLTRETDNTVETMRVDLVQLLAFGNVQENHVLRKGDIVYVPRMEVFYVYGEVARPGSYRLERQMTVMQAIAVAGGLTPRARDRGISVKRKDAGGVVKDYSIRLTEMLQPDDVLHVSEGLF